MVPQDNNELRSENDLGFMTEVDAEILKAPKDSHVSDRIISTRHSEIGAEECNTSMPQNQSSLLEIEQAEFKQVIKELISKEQADQLQLEERILEKMRKRALSKGWDRPSGAKQAPLKVLQSMSS